MTPRERAREATWDTGGHDWTTVDRERLESRVEQAITAAVEAEREACAKIAAGNTPEHDTGEIERLIRDRSEGGKK